MRRLASLVLVLFFSLTGSARADILHLYNGHGGEFKWSGNTSLFPLAKIAESGERPGSGSGFLPLPVAFSFPFGTEVDGNYMNNARQGSDSLTLTQNNRTSFYSSLQFATGYGKQFDVAQYTYYAFTVTETKLYELKFSASGDFNHLNYPTRSPNFIFAGTDSVFNFYETALGPDASLARFSLSAGSQGTHDNHAFSVFPPYDQVTNDSIQRVTLEAGKLYQADIFSYAYVGGDGEFYGQTQSSNSLRITAVPEPASLTLFASLLSCAAFTTARKRLRRSDANKVSR